MIVSAILYIVYYTLYLLLSPIFLFSDVSANSGFGQAVANSTHYLASINVFFPVDTLMVILSLTLTVETIIAGYKLIMWVIRRIPTQS